MSSRRFLLAFGAAILFAVRAVGVASAAILIAAYILNFVAAILITVGVASAGAAQPQKSAVQPPAPKAVPEAGAFITDLARQAVARLTAADLEAAERNHRFQGLLNKGFDVPAIARFSLGRYWRLATEKERAEYVKLFEDLIVQTYAARFVDYAGEALRVTHTRADSDGDVLVFSEFERSNGPPIRVDWRLRRDGESFKIYDVVVEGVSMAITQRDDFSAAIQRSGGKVEGLLAALRDKTGAAR
ncbi:MAG: MlaC/ttg2D family ABC transporter substrate-binding protein [Pseudomonadota bacterium]